MLKQYLIYSSGKAGAQLTLHGAWEGPAAEEILQALHSLPALATPLQLRGEGLERLDTAGAWVLVRWLRERQASGVQFEVTGFAPDHARVIELVERLGSGLEETPPPLKMAVSWHAPMVALGRSVMQGWRELFDLVAFLGELTLALGRLLRNPRRLRVRSFIYHLHHVGLMAVPIIALLAFLISLVLGYQGVAQLSKFNAQTFTLDAVAISMFREMGVLLTSIMVAGRSGSAFTAQIGIMKLNQEVDAMRTLGLDPFEVLVLPRVLAILLAVPVLTFIADMVGLLGAVTVGVSMLDMSAEQCITRLDYMLRLNTFWIGMVKAPVFALLIGLVCCLRGLRVQNAADEVGRETTTAVVQSIFLIIMADAAFSILFTVLKI